MTVIEVTYPLIVAVVSFVAGFAVCAALAYRDRKGVG